VADGVGGVKKVLEGEHRAVGEVDNSLQTATLNKSCVPENTMYDELLSC